MAFQYEMINRPTKIAFFIKKRKLSAGVSVYERAKENCVTD